VNPILTALMTGFGIGWIAGMSPGPDTALVLRSVMADGRRGGATCSLGIGLSMFVYASASIASLGLLRKASPEVLSFFRIASASYLIWLGISLIRSGPSKPASEKVGPAGGALRGFFCNITNPKTFLFFSALGTHFLTTGREQEYAAVVAGAAVAVPTWFLMLTMLSGYFQERLQSARRFLDVVAGLVLVMFGLSALVA
jgi:threonine/homoserine/homoserine lactone efflux protein